MSLPSFIDEGDGSALVCLHGVGSGKEGFARQRAAVIAAGWRFIAIDAPGFGETPAPDAPGFAPHVDAVIAVLDHLGIDRAVILGHSLGGMSAQEVFATHRSRVRGLILSATSPAFGRGDGNFQKKFIADRLKPFEDGMTMDAFARTFAPKLVGPKPEEGAVEAVIETMRSVPVDTYITAMRTITTFDRRDQLAHIDVPTLLISGEHDTNSPAPMMEKMASKIPNASYVMLEATGHMAPIENSARFNQIVVEFLGALEPC